MNTQAIDDLLSISLERLYTGDKGFHFEQFIQKLLTCIHGAEFVSTSPFKDGSIDGFFRLKGEFIFNSGTNPLMFIQIGTTKEFKNKIATTIEEVRVKGLEINQLLYYTPHKVSNLYTTQSELSREHNIPIQIIDHAQLVAMSASGECYDQFNNFITSTIHMFSTETAKELYKPINNAELYLNIWHLHTHGKRDQDLKFDMIDNLILWSLRDTDPEQEQYMTKEEILKVIISTFNSHKSLIQDMFKNRFKVLCKQRVSDGLKTYKKIQQHGDKYCLPYVSRTQFKAVFQNSVNVHTKTIESITERFNKSNVPYKEVHIKIILAILKEAYAEYGFKFVEFLEEKISSDIQIFNFSDLYAKAIQSFPDKVNNKEKENIIYFLTEVLNTPSEIEKKYLESTKMLFILHFLMNNNIELSRFFTKKTSELKLYINSDILIKAISEHYIEKSNQNFRNMLGFLKDHKITMFLTEFSLNEIFHNLQNASYEYHNYLRFYDTTFNKETIKYLPKIMNRAYFYSKIEGKVTSWTNFINNFVDYKKLLYSEREAKNELKEYLCKHYRLEFLSIDKMNEKVNEKSVTNLATKLAHLKTNENIAKGISTTAHYLMYIRKENEGTYKDGMFGYSNWWLTEEKMSYNVVKDFMGNDRFAIRPDFIINRLMLNPTENQIQSTYASTFPTAIGLHLSEQLDRSVYKLIINKLDEVRSHDEARAQVMVNEIFKRAAEVIGGSNTSAVRIIDFHEEENASIGIIGDVKGADALIKLLKEYT